MKLTFEGVTAAYRRKAVLEDISFSVPKGSITALIGRNGAGKSTLIRCLTGEKQDYRGRILLDGQDLRALDANRRAASLACLPQTLPRPHVTVEELVGFGRTPYTPLTGKLSPEDREKVRWAINAVGMERMRDSFVDTLSGGERKKAFFAMTLAQDTPLVILDEPTAHLDAVSRFEFLDLVEDMRCRTGKTFLVVMHDLPEILQCADRIVAINQNRVAFDGTPGDFLAEDIPQSCFQVRVTGSKDGGYAVTPLK